MPQCHGEVRGAHHLDGLREQRERVRRALQRGTERVPGEELLLAPPDLRALRALPQGYDERDLVRRAQRPEVNSAERRDEALRVAASEEWEKPHLVARLHPGHQRERLLGLGGVQLRLEDAQERVALAQQRQQQRDAPGASPQYEAPAPRRPRERAEEGNPRGVEVILKLCVR